MANYISMVFQFGSQNVFQYFNTTTDFHLPTYGSDMTALGQELDEILSRSNFTMLNLLESIAIPCQAFITYCEIHNNIHVQCCSEMFDERPMFTAQGTCYVSNMRIVETSPFTFSS